MGRPRKVITETASAEFNKIQVENAQKKEAEDASVIKESWLAINGNKLLQKHRNALGSVHSIYLGDKRNKKTADFMKKCKKDNVNIEVC